MKSLVHFILYGFCSCLAFSTADGAGLMDSNTRFYYTNSSGRASSATIVRHYWPGSVSHPAQIDTRLDPSLRRAATIAQERAYAHSKSRCWHYVKQALVAAGAVTSYPKTAYAIDAGKELVQNYGFKRLPIKDPYSAPLGSVLVYGDLARGHVEIRTKDGFASDYRSKNPCFYHLIAVYGKFSVATVSSTTRPNLDQSKTALASTTHAVKRIARNDRAAGNVRSVR